MTKRKLTPDEIAEVASKEWKKTPIFTSDEKVAYKAKNLTGPKTVEGKMKSLANLQAGRNAGDVSPTKHGGYVRRILNEDEQELYFSRREEYLKDYDINGSADEITLHQVLMEEVIYFRLQVKLAEKPSLADTIDRPLSECTGRLNRALDNLGALRRQRLNQNEKSNTISIGTLAQQFARELMNGSLQDDLKAQQEEEARFLAQKKEREAHTIDAEYEVVQDNGIEEE
ncbi:MULTISPECIES: hypothetical protein [Paenibacillus]|uniref:hypothetical protein n=1 Tax=Paenibacillus TaxID=44249 RepID=UPI000F51B644|nr:hypothetical protein [Paenibacillus xylanexedens]RPK20077.1 hypothetical protein EDO6_06594 [Paenibacillus xylanexedens]